ncbi:MAG: PAS domain-containing protein [Alphaproteobacteria bacterium]|nr:PAS domain-containing protein [Alphaproteobacteria bacterium]
MHKLLERQLKRIEGSPDCLPNNLDQWQSFLNRINNYYVETENERYLLQRSMEISSKELMDLNRLLEHAQHIAKIGHWYIDVTNKNIVLSKELRFILGVQAAEETITVKDLIRGIVEEDREVVKHAINDLALKGEPFKSEFRYILANGELRWFYMAGQPFRHCDSDLREFTGIAMDITDRKIAEEAVEELNNKLLRAAREAGKADISTSILHNVGNILNSVSVSLDLLKEAMMRSKCSKFRDVSELMINHKDDLGEYLVNDEKGRLIPDYIHKLSENVSTEFNTCSEEVVNLTSYIEHIKEIVASQNSFSTKAKIQEKIPAIKIVESALKMSGTANSLGENIKIKKCFGTNTELILDKSKALQILVNLIQNAREAVLLNEAQMQKEVLICIEDIANENNVKIMIQDNGMGIDPENITKIFSFGFSTKRDGHGFGLHASALAATEMGGSLTAESDGPGKGARFILTLPAA